ncbi:MAG: carbon-nitrogen hydrolase family protein [Victivallaceae bacterium]|nr:carbon-nitrogen hydrolase family protein [Victivallaceae bacterium]
MANYIKIGTFGPAWHTLPEAFSNEQIIDGMIEFWEQQFVQVLHDKPDLIVVPESCDIPANLPMGKRRLDYYRARGNRVLDYFSQVAREHHCNIVYASNIYMPDGKLRNAAMMINRAGKVIGSYNKNHLVPEEYDNEGIIYGDEAPLIECDFGRVAFAICFDLNFDNIRLKHVAQKPDLIIFPSLYHGGLMQNYWAYSCRCHFIGAVAGLPSEIRNPFGDVVATTTGYSNFVTAMVNLDCCLVKLDQINDKRTAIKAEYGSAVDIAVPANLGVALVSSTTDKITAREVIAQFGIMTLDDYFTNVQEHRTQSLGG